MGIKRGVSLYSYQQAGFFRQMSWKDMIREVHDNLKTDGIEIIDEMIIRGYPYPSEAFYDEWNNEMAKYNMNAVTMDVFLDVHQFRDHVMSYDEAAERLKNDIVIASKMGFKNIRTLCLVPIEVIEKALPTAEKYNIKIGKEIHAPLTIKYGANAAMEKDLLLDPRSVDQIIDLVQKTGTKHLGLVPDFGIFQYAPSVPAIEYTRRHCGYPELVDYVLSCRGKMQDDEIWDSINQKYPGHNIRNVKELHNYLTVNKMCSRPEDLKDILPYIVSIHGKFFHMSEKPGKPGHYEDVSINYVDPIRILKEEGFDGYINSEFEGQRYTQDSIRENMVDEVEQVRKHHQMLTELIGEE